MRYLVVLLVLLTVSLSGCRPPEPAATSASSAGNSDGIKVSLELPQKPKIGPAPVRVYLLGADNKAVTGATVTVTGLMTHAGMEPVIAEAPATENGLYQTKNFDFNMAGDWILQADVTLPDGDEVRKELSVTVPGS